MKRLWICIVLLTACGKPPVDGTNGSNGSNGAQGIQGTPGQNAIPDTAVKFCPSIPDVYPNSFPEYGVCISNNIYAVYWSGSTAFLTKLTPGVYSTTSNEVNCNFTVVSNSCIIH